MSEEEFAQLSLTSKWMHVEQTMDYILTMERNYQGQATAYHMRRRLNPHHPTDDVQKEEKAFKREQRNMRVDQYQRWAHIKSLYAAHRDEMANTLDSEKYAECKRILESVFTMELDDALHDVLEE